MDRRSFIKGIAALAVSSQISSEILAKEKSIIERLNSGEKISETVYISEPLVIEGHHSIMFEDLKVVVKDDFVGDSAIIAKGKIVGCNICILDSHQKCKSMLLCETDSYVDLSSFIVIGKVNPVNLNYIPIT